MKYMTIATIIAGISGFVVVILAARAFGTDTALTTEFAAYWGLFFAATGFLTGITQETTRAVAAAKKHGTLSPGSGSAATPLARPIVIAASGASAILITGFPTLVQLTHGADNHAAISTAVVVYAVTLTRAPILVPLQQFLSAIIVRFVHHTTHPRRALIQPLAAAISTAVVVNAVTLTRAPILVPLPRGLSAPG